MASTYRAVEISSPGVFSLVERKAAVPGAGKSEVVAPLVCAGITTFNALCNAAPAGDTVAIQGVAGLGHLDGQFARKLGLRTVAILPSGAHYDLNKFKSLR